MKMSKFHYDPEDEESDFPDFPRSDPSPDTEEIEIDAM